MDKTHLMKFPNTMIFNFLQLIMLEDNEKAVWCFGKKLESEINNGGQRCTLCCCEKRGGTVVILQITLKKLN